MLKSSQLLNRVCTSSTVCRNFHLSTPNFEVRLLSRLRVVDNSELGKQAMAEGKPPKVFHVYNKTGVGTIGNSLYLFIGEQIELLP
jgi:large subunit ribosomal protein L14